jgi:thioredoxin reductase
MTDHEVVIVGGGAAGLSAALVLGRARRAVAVVDAGEPRNAPAAHMHGFLSREGLPPTDLLAAGRAEVRRYGGQVLHGTVRRIVVRGDRLTGLELGDGWVVADATGRATVGTRAGAPLDARSVSR